MKAVLIDILTTVAFRLGIISSYSETIPADKKQQLIDMINDVKDDITEYVTLPSLLSDELPPINTAGVYSTGTIAIANGSVTGTLTTGVLTSAMVSRKIQIGSDYSIYTIKSVNTGAGTFTIDRPFFGSSETVATFAMFQDIYQVPTIVRKIIALTDLANSDNQIVEYPAEVLTKIFPDPTRYYGDAIGFSSIGSGYNSESVTLTNATPTTITASNLTGTYDNYYKDWLLKNETDGSVMRIISSVASTGLITIDSAIVNMAITDTITLIQPYLKIMIRNTPSDTLSLRCVGYRQFTPLINDLDIEYEIPESYAQSVLTSGLMYFYKVNVEKESGSNLLILQKQYEDIREDIKREVGRMPSRTYRFGQMRTTPELNRRNGGGWGFDRF
jgi:hypothetical protein